MWQVIEKGWCERQVIRASPVGKKECSVENFQKVHDWFNAFLPLDLFLN